jgi:hypothetical protein
MHCARVDSARCGIEVLEPHDPIALRQRQCCTAHLPSELEKTSTESYRGGECQTADDRETRILQQHAAAELPVQPGCLEIRQARPRALIARCFTEAIDAAEVLHRLATRILCGHASVDVVLRFAVDVELHFFRGGLVLCVRVPPFLEAIFQRHGFTWSLRRGRDSTLLE